MGVYIGVPLVDRMWLCVYYWVYIGGNGKENGNYYLGFRV